MKTLLLWLLLIILGVGVVLYLNPHWAERLRTLATGESNSTTVYKWRDEHGEWHVTDEPPPAGTEYQTQEYLPDTNVLPPPADAPSGQR